MATRSDNNAFVASGSGPVAALARNSMQARLLNTYVPHLIPILDSLPASSVVCDVGCGPGSITIDLAQRYPELVVFGTDVDEQSIKQAKEAVATAGIQNIRFAVGDAVHLTALTTAPGFEALNGGCDLVYSHAALINTANGLQVVKEMHRAAKVGGTVSLKEGDIGLCFIYPENEGTVKFLEVQPKLTAARGADPYFGRKMLSYAMAAGFSRGDVIDLSMGGTQFSK